VISSQSGDSDELQLASWSAWGVEPGVEGQLPDGMGVPSSRTFLRLMLSECI